MRQLVEIDSKIDEDDAKAILLNSLSSKYDNVIFTLNQMPYQSLDEMIVALMVEEKRIGDTDASPHNELALFSKGRVNKNGIECFYCHKYGHTALNCKIRAKDLLKGRLKECFVVGCASLWCDLEYIIIVWGLRSLCRIDC